MLYTEVADALATNARYADIVISASSIRTIRRRPRYLPQQAILGCGRPALVVPYIGPAATFGERAMVAWDASREAARAVNDALPLLERPGRSAWSRSTPATARSGMARSRAPTSASTSPATASRSTSSASRRATSTRPTRSSSHLASEGADLLVMGAYGHSRMREFVLGGVTRTILAEMTVPALMSH